MIVHMIYSKLFCCAESYPVLLGDIEVCFSLVPFKLRILLDFGSGNQLPVRSNPSKTYPLIGLKQS